MLQEIVSHTKALIQGAMAMSCLVLLVTTPYTRASDHRDGPQVKADSNKVGDIADLYVFKESEQSANDADNSKMVFVLTTNGLVTPGTPNTFSSQVAYEIKVALGKQATANPKTLSFRFGTPESNGRQSIFLNTQLVGTTTVNETPVNNVAEINNHKIKVFAGMREDPFFLDLRVIQEGLHTGKSDPKDTFAGSNVSTIVASVPVAYFQSDAKESVFSVWAVTKK